MEGLYYHVLNRGVEKRQIFFKDKDYVRFAHNLLDFNTTDSNAHVSYNKRRSAPKSVIYKQRTTESIVNVLCWSLMPNHVHLMLQEKIYGNAGNFSRKIFGGYTKYFNEQRKRSGVLFQGKSKILLIQNNSHLIYLPFYIHLNPLDIYQPGWKSDGIKNIKGAMKFLEEYRWSNYRDIVGAGNGEFTNIANTELFYDTFQTDEKLYKKDLKEWIIQRGYQSRKETFYDFD